jgi:membrane-associated phospholipid phosphatase
MWYIPRVPSFKKVPGVLVLLACLNVRATLAQSTGDKTLFTWRDAALAGGFTALTIAMFPLDKSAAHRLQLEGNQENRFFHNASRTVQAVADPGAVVIGAGLYVLGRTRGWRAVADIGVHGGEAVVLSGTITAALKGMAGRARPNVVGDTNPRDFKFLRGFTKGNGYESFPSGHTTVAFAAAAAVTSESRHWWPQGQWIVGPVLYGGATLVGLSRMYNNDHWASDVSLAAAIGTFSGLKVVRYAHNHPQNPVDRILLPLSVSAGDNGRALVGFNVPF